MMSKPRGRAFSVERSKTMIASVVLHHSRLRPDQNTVNNRNQRR
jgi:hypothetical protein